MRTTCWPSACSKPLHQFGLAGQPQNSAANPEGRYQLFRIGDAVAARNTHAAIYDALRLVKDL